MSNIRQAILRWAATVLLTLLVAYPLSYSPVVRLRNGPTDGVSDYKNCRRLAVTVLQAGRLAD